MSTEPRKWMVYGVAIVTAVDRREATDKAKRGELDGPWDTLDDVGGFFEPEPHEWDEDAVDPFVCAECGMALVRQAGWSERACSHQSAQVVRQSKYEKRLRRRKGVEAQPEQCEGDCKGIAW